MEAADSVDAAASELYRMTDSKWRQLLKDAMIVAEREKRAHLTTMAASNIFRSVNQRRDNLERGQQRGTKGGAHMTPDRAAHVAIGEATGLGSASASASSFAAGSLFGFTFSEFLEGLIHVSIELTQSAAGGGGGAQSRSANAISTPVVIAGVRSLIEQRILPNAKTSNVLEFRRAALDSMRLTEALDAIRRPIDQIWSYFAHRPQKVGAQGKQKLLPDATGFSLQHFLELAQEAQLIGGALSRMQAKTVFISALEISAESAGGRRPLLTRAEFGEALLRLCYAYEPTPDELLQSSGTPGTRQRRSTLAGDGGARANLFAQGVAGKVTPQTSTPQHTPRHTPRHTPSAARGEAAFSPATMEDVILERLPLVMGRLLAVFEQQYSASSGPARFMA